MPPIFPLVNRQRKKAKGLLILIIGLSFVFFYFTNVLPVFAQQDIMGTTQEVGDATILGQADPRVIVARVIQFFLGFLGVIFIALVIYGGWLYMSSGGDNAKIESAKKVLVNAIIGLIIIVCAFAIATFILNKLSEALGMNIGGSSRSYVAPGIGNGNLGSIIQDHFPGVNMTVPRNTVIMVTFKEPIVPSSLMKDGTITCLDAQRIACQPVVDTNCVCQGEINVEAVQIYKACDSIYPSGAATPDDYNEANRAQPDICNTWRGDIPRDGGDVDTTKLVGSDTAADYDATSKTTVTVTPDFRTLVVNPYGMSADKHLGSPLSDVTYFVRLTNEIISGVRANTGVFNSSRDKFYLWNFNTNTTIDITAPFITGVYPVDRDDDGQPLPGSNDRAKYRNSMIRVDFSEAVIPPMVLRFTSSNESSPDYVGAEMVIENSLAATGAKMITGDLIVGLNQYRSILFKTNMDCGAGLVMNSCGDEVRCLPANANIATEVRSPAISYLQNSVGPTVTLFPAGGMVDAALNALDTDGRLGRGNGRTEGAIDNFNWDFNTTDILDLMPPSIVDSGTNPVDSGIIGGLTPAIGGDKSSGVTPNSIVSAYYTEELNPATTTNTNMLITSSADWSGWWTGGLYCPTETAADGSTFCFTNARVALLNHANFIEPQTEDDVPYFFPVLKSGIQDMQANCFNPCVGPIVGTGCENLQPGQACCPLLSDDETATPVMDIPTAIDKQDKTQTIDLDYCPTP